VQHHSAAGTRTRSATARPCEFDIAEATAVHPGAVRVLVELIAVYLLGSLSGFRQGLLGLEPFTHIPRVGSGSFSPVPLLWLLAIGAALTTLGGFPTP
jgi:hypothetical protein